MSLPTTSPMPRACVAAMSRTWIQIVAASTPVDWCCSTIRRQKPKRSLAQAYLASTTTIARHDSSGMGRAGSPKASIGCVGLARPANADFEYYELPVVVLGVRT